MYAIWIALRHHQKLCALSRQAVPGQAIRRAPYGRSPTVEDQIVHLRPEFGGKSELLFFVYCCAVKARRSDNPIRQAEMIRYCLSRFGPTLHAEINTRWLVSLLNTLADHGRRGEAEAARAVTVWLHGMKVYETAAYLERTGNENFPAAMNDYTHRRLARWGDPAVFTELELWDYMFVMELTVGDVLKNVHARLRDERYPIVRDAFDTAVGRIEGSDTVMRRIMAGNRHFPAVS